MRRHNMKELLKYLDNKISMYEKMDNAYSFAVFGELITVKLALNKIEKNIPNFDKYSAMFMVSIKEQLRRLKEYEPHKNGWDNIRLNYCFGKIQENLNVISSIGTDDIRDDIKSLITHLADIANYTNMAILKCQKYLDGEEEYDGE
jgi:hypothetical protein